MVALPVPTQTEEEIVAAQFIELEATNDTNVQKTNFSRGDLYLSIGDKFGDKKKFLERTFGRDRANKLYNTYRKCAVIAKRFPPGCRNLKTWEDYRNKISKENGAFRSKTLFPTGTKIPLYIDGVEPPVACIVLQPNRAVVIVGKQQLTVGREEVERAIGEEWGAKDNASPQLTMVNAPPKSVAEEFAEDELSEEELWYSND